MACPSGGGNGGDTDPPSPSPPPAVTNASPGGIWEGLDSDGGEVIALVTETGRFHFIDEFLSQGSGTLTVSNGNDVAGNFQLATELGFTSPDGTTLADCTLSGTVIERQSMTVAVDCTTTTGLQDQVMVALTYNALYERDSSLATVAGTYDDGTGIETDIAADGTIFGTDPVSGCVTNGQLSVIDSAFNAYDVQFAINNCTEQSPAFFGGLGDLAGGGFSSQAFAISADGSVVVGEGTSALGTEAFRWTIRDGMVGLGTLAGDSQALGVSADGSIVVGISAPQAFQLGRWRDDGSWVPAGGRPRPGMGYLRGRLDRCGKQLRFGHRSPLGQWRH